MNKFYRLNIINANNQQYQILINISHISVIDLTQNVLILQIPNAAKYARNTIGGNRDFVIETTSYKVASSDLETLMQAIEVIN